DTAQHHSLRNYCMIYLAFIHGLRASELLSLQLTDYDPLASTLSIRRIKGGLSTIHPLSPEEGHIISLWLQERSRSSSADSPWFSLHETTHTSPVSVSGRLSVSTVSWPG
ncbi:TPA: tyrosine-type recombinase/integrase, partial [Escherichia coli]